MVMHKENIGENERHTKNMILKVIISSLILFSFIQTSFADENIIYDYNIFEDRYLCDYSEGFFKAGGEQVPFNENLNLKIGIVIKNKSRMSIGEIINVIFSVAPFDRYRRFFVFVDHNKLERIRRRNDFFVEAYNSYGRKMPGGFDIENSSVRAGLIVLNVDDYEFTRTGTLGYASDKLAVAQKMTILHELAHVLANLGDEYSMGEISDEQKEIHGILERIGIPCNHDKYKVWNTEKANIDYRGHKVLKWQPLIEQGFIPDERIKRVQIENGVDVGRFLIPTRKCIMNRIVSDNMEFCPVCQLQIIDSICRLSGAIPPWRTKIKEKE